MTVALVGSGPAREAVAAALGDVDAQVTDLDPTVVGGADLAVVVGQAGDVAFETVDERARESGVPWLAVEVGGVGGYPVVEAAVSGFGPGTACYRCLQSRVRSNADPDQEPQAAPDAGTARFAGSIAGREAAKLVAGERSSIIGGVIEVPRTQRQFLPVPDCICAVERDRALDDDHVERDLEASLARAERGLDERVGVVAEVGEAESFPTPYYLANVANTSEFSDATAPRQAAGVAADWNAAFMKALGEGYERYSAGVYRTAEFETGTAADIDDAVPPSTFVCADGDDWTAADEHTEVEWVPGRNLDTDGDVWLPAEFVHFPPPAERFRPAVTTGLGLGNGAVEALLSGLYEIVERDAAMLSWYSTFDPLALSVEDETFGTLRRRATSEGLDVVPLLLTQDVDVPVVAAAVHREEWPRFAVGLSAHLDPALAARSALAEALQNWLELRGMGAADAADESGAIGHFADFPGEAQTYLAVSSSVPAAQVGPTDLPTGRDHLDAVVSRLRDADLDVYASRLTTRDVDALGFETVRAVVPSAQPLFFDSPYFGERAETVPQSMGFEPRLDRDHHPYP
ncbi:YcaO-like family protein [Halorientalis sp.]|uniref:YcaO-like family protein n=1 Tax=Halorientalis sp. TaxID=1931229 RepID=UPI0026095714|nr:YcaO-like family protein [Halorientalis sp.]